MLSLDESGDLLKRDCNPLCRRRILIQNSTKGSEDIIHQSLKGGRSIGEAKRHNQKLVMAAIGKPFSLCLLNVTDLVIPRP